MTVTASTIPADLSTTVHRALCEDVGTGDLTTKLVPAANNAEATVISREKAIICGIPWFNEVFKQLNDSTQIQWHCSDGDEVSPDQILCNLQGNSHNLLSGERTALNFLQLLSGTATITRYFVELIVSQKTKLLDTRKTIPGLRTAQKYAVACGGGTNHRIGLYDAILIKENHIRAAGGIAKVVQEAKVLHRKVEVEVESLEELEQAIEAEASIVLLDNFDIKMIKDAVKLAAKRVKLEVSGGIDKKELHAIAETGIDYISIGSLTKNINAIDFSMLIN